MTLHEYMLSLSPAQREDFASKCGTTVNYLWKLARNFERGLRPGAKLASRIEVHSNQKVRRWESNPETWSGTWPELIGSPGSPGLVSAMGVA